MHRGPNGRHVCMVFEILGISLLDVIKIYEFKGIPIDICKGFIRKILNGLNFLHKNCGVIHTDLKPENILIQLTKLQSEEMITYGEIKTHIKIREVSDKKSRILENQAKNLQKTLKISEKKCKKTENSNFSSKNHEDYPKTVSKNIENKKTFSIPHSQPTKTPVFCKNLDLKIVDFGNSVYTSSLCSEIIQTRQYRSPEVILGYNYTTAADI